MNSRTTVWGIGSTIAMLVGANTACAGHRNCGGYERGYYTRDYGGQLEAGRHYQRSYASSRYSARSHHYRRAHDRVRHHGDSIGHGSRRSHRGYSYQPSYGRSIFGVRRHSRHGGRFSRGQRDGIRHQGIAAQRRHHR